MSADSPGAPECQQISVLLSKVLRETGREGAAVQFGAF
jgi:hypothetical protein